VNHDISLHTQELTRRTERLPHSPKDAAAALHASHVDLRLGVLQGLAEDDFHDLNSFVRHALLRRLWLRGHEALVLQLKHESSDEVYAVLRLLGGGTFDLTHETDRALHAEATALVGDARDAIAADPAIRPMVEAILAIWYREATDLEQELYEIYAAWPSFVATLRGPSDVGCPALDSHIRLLSTLQGAARIDYASCGECSECSRPRRRQRLFTLAQYHTCATLWIAVPRAARPRRTAPGPPGPFHPLTRELVR
jgi:hypothetical protein